MTCLGGGRRVQTATNNEQAVAVRTAAAQLAVGGRLGPVDVGRRDETVQELVVHQHALVSGTKLA